MTKTATIEETKVEKKKVTWEDFTLEEHVQAHMGGLPQGCVLQMKTIVEGKVFRVNIFNPETEKFVKSKALRIITTPEGYIFEPWQVDENIEQNQI